MWYTCSSKVVLLAEQAQRTNNFVKTKYKQLSNITSHDSDPTLICSMDSNPGPVVSLSKWFAVAIVVLF